MRTWFEYGTAALPDIPNKIQYLASINIDSIHKSYIDLHMLDQYILCISTLENDLFKF